MRLQRGLLPRRRRSENLHGRIRRRASPFVGLEGGPCGRDKKIYDGCVRLYGESGKLKICRVVGCDKCNQTGYKGRIGLHELMIADDAAKKIIQERA
ncbi:ATPase, T2SS/T4P/T4SS family [Polaromonas eurypsychrophila]|uniref:ATPase, T2SS/T4P/T4SS family n=1 Tax=Polaromonas eurypsychrophila TaxID=1614635 RepID=UPI004032941E